MQPLVDGTVTGVKPFTNAIGLWAFGFCACVIDPLKIQVERKLVVLVVAAVLATSVVSHMVSMTQQNAAMGENLAAAAKSLQLQ